MKSSSSLSIDREKKEGGREGKRKEERRTFWNVGQSARQIGYKQATQQILEFLIVSPIREDGFGEEREGFREELLIFKNMPATMSLLLRSLSLSISLLSFVKAFP